MSDKNYKAIERELSRVWTVEVTQAEGSKKVPVEMKHLLVDHSLSFQLQTGEMRGHKISLDFSAELLGKALETIMLYEGAKDAAAALRLAMESFDKIAYRDS